LLDEGAPPRGRGTRCVTSRSKPRALLVLTDTCGRLQNPQPRVALVRGRHGPPSTNFHTHAMTAKAMAKRRPKPELYLAGRKAEAVAAVPDDFIDMARWWAEDRIRERFRRGPTAARRASPCHPADDAIELMADLAGADRAAGSDLPRPSPGPSPRTEPRTDPTDQG